MQTDPKHEKTLRKIEWFNEIFNTAVYYFAAFMVFRYWLDMAFWVALPACIMCFLFMLAVKKVEKPIVERLVRPFVKENPEDQE